MKPDTITKALVLRIGGELADGYRGKPLCVLADVSSSMGEMNDGGKMKFAEMRDALCKGLANRDDFSLVAFSHRLEVVAKPEELTLLGGATYLAAALLAIKRQKPEHILIVTDGYPTDDPADSCIAVLQKHFPWVRVDVLFVGSKGDKSAIELMKATVQCGGEFRHLRQNYLEGVRYLLGNGGVE